MNKKILILLSIPVFFWNCSTKKITLEQFKTNFQTKEVIITLESYGGRTADLKCFSFEFNNKKYLIYPIFPDRLYKGIQFKALIDENNPGKNFYVLWDKIVKPNEPNSSISVKIESVFILSEEDYACIEISFNRTKSKLYNIIGLNSYYFATNKKYLNLLKKMQKQKIGLVLDYYLTTELNNETLGIYDINYEHLDSLNNKLNL